MKRVRGQGGIATNWRQVSAITGSGVKSMPWVPEGQRSGRMSYTTANKSANYVTLGEEDSVTVEAINAAEGFEDIQSTLAMRLLQQTMMKEEYAILGGNSSLALGTPNAATLAAAGSGATLPAATYSVIVVALTLEGHLASSLSGGVVQAQSITGADGKTFTLNGGSSNKSASATQAITLGQTLSATVPVVNGAAAYAWYVGTAGAETLQAITSLNSATFSAPLTGGQQAATAITVDASRNATYAFDGLLASAFNSGGAAYVKVMPSGTAGAGTGLTAGGRRNIVEIDVMLKQMWDQYRLGPTVIYCNSQELQNITNKVMSSSASPIFAANQSEPYAVVANGVVQGYFNPFVAQGQSSVVKLVLHPFIPAGTILAYAENLPAQYQSNEVPNVAEVHVRKDYVQTYWPQVTRSRDVGVYVEEALAVYAPFALGIITNIGNA
ncbi:MAG: hypothetical protein JSR70_07565 [Proteobacteria bacterium]|nr:hypothetical protein [Pseudomonadota bacterium]